MPKYDRYYNFSVFIRNDELASSVKVSKHTVNMTRGHYSLLLAVRLPDDGSSVLSQATSLLVRGLGDHTTIVRTTRLNGHDDQPGIVKIEVPTKDDMISILRNKSNLAGKAPYENTYLRSSQPHVARFQAANLRVIMDKVPALSDCRLTGNGRIVSSHDNRPPRIFYNTSSSRRDIPSDRHNRDHLSGFRDKMSIPCDQLVMPREQQSVPHDQPSSSIDQLSHPRDRRSPRNTRAVIWAVRTFRC